MEKNDEFADYFINWIVPGDYDGYSKIDFTVYRSNPGHLYILALGGGNPAEWPEKEISGMSEYVLPVR